MPIAVKFVPLAAAPASGSATYESATIQNGYGLTNTVGVKATIGATVTAKVAFIVTTVTDQTVMEWYDKVSTNLSVDQKETLQQYNSQGYSASLVCGFLGVAFGTSSSSYTNSTSQLNTSGDTTKEGYLKQLSQLQTSQQIITGDIAVTGMSYIPSEGYIFVETTTLTFSDQTLILVNTGNPAVASKDGDTGATSGTGKLAMAPALT